MRQLIIFETVDEQGIAIGQYWHTLALAQQAASEMGLKVERRIVPLPNVIEESSKLEPQDFCLSRILSEDH